MKSLNQSKIDSELIVTLSERIAWAHCQISLALADNNDVAVRAWSNYLLNVEPLLQLIVEEKS